MQIIFRKVKSNLDQTDNELITRFDSIVDTYQV